MENALLKVNMLQKFFKIKRGFPNPVTVTVRAVDQVSFHVNQSESFGLVGESACGKSTIGRCILRLVEPDSGSVYFRGEDILRARLDRMPLLRRKLQIIFQDPYSSLNPRRSIGKAIEEPMMVHKIGNRSEIQKKMSSLLEEVGLSPENEYKFPHQLSGGQRQRIGIARALALEPELIIADEPVSSLDVSIQSQILDLLNKLKEKYHLSYIFISHDLAVVRYFCNRLGVMYLGRFVEQGPVNEIFEKPLHPYTQLLRDASPVPDPRARKPVIKLEGEVASAIDPPSGCYFNPRCPECMEICCSEYPSWKWLSPDRGVACHLYGR
jgi:oligopeptide/dipeptide ABC transporter ATP-binding protein